MNLHGLPFGGQEADATDDTSTPSIFRGLCVRACMRVHVHTRAQCLVSVTTLCTVPHAFVNLSSMARCLLESQEEGADEETLSGFNSEAPQLASGRRRWEAGPGASRYKVATN